MGIHEGPAPYGSLFVRDAAAARAQALAEKVELISSQGGEVPAGLAALAAEAGPAGDVVVVVEADPVTLDAWRLCGDEPVVAAVPVVVEPVAEVVEVVEELAVEEPVVEVVEEAAVEVEAPASPFGAFSPAEGFAAPKKRAAKKPSA